MNNKQTIVIIIGLILLVVFFFFTLRDIESMVVMNEKYLTPDNLENSSQEQPVKDKARVSDVPALEKNSTDVDYEENELQITNDWKTSVYTDPLPEIPSKQDAIHGFPDTNNNGVRDDIEILVVKQWGDHKVMVETFFAQSRTSQYDIDAVSDGEITKDEIKKSNELLAKDGACRFFYYTNTVGSADEYFQEKTYEIVSKNYYNSLTRLGYLEEMRKAVHGSISRSVKMDHEKCQDYFRQTKELQKGE